MDESYLIYPRLSVQLHSPARYHGDASPHLSLCVPVIHLLPACRLVYSLVHRYLGVAVFVLCRPRGIFFRTQFYFMIYCTF